MYKVLIVEDEDIIRKGLMFMVNWQEAGCVVVGEGVDGQDGLEKIRENRPDIVIVDINMPVKDGLAMLEEKQEEDFRELLKEELAENKEKAERLKQELTLLLIPKDPNDEKNVIMEIRGGAGGDEAALFAGDLFRMYARYAERRKWKIEIMNTSESDLGGFKEISFMIKGEGAYSRLKYESGVHRVQRVPVTERRRTRAYLNGDGGSAAGGGGGRCAY